MKNSTNSKTPKLVNFEKLALTNTHAIKGGEDGDNIIVEDILGI